MSENKVTSKNEDADNKFKIQLRVVKKIIKNILVVSKHRFPQVLLYQITKFVFKNPLRFRKTLYCRNTLNELKVNTQYLLRRTSNITQNQYQNQMQKARDLSLRESAKKDERQKEKDKVWVNKDKNTSEYTSYITIIKSWKATIVNQNDYTQVLQKARLFFVFLSSIKLFLGKQIYKDSDSNPLTDFHNYQNKQKELNKYHHLICDHFQLYYSYFQQIFKYQKDKKLNVVVIKAFISLMSKNMSLVKIEQNYNTESLQCESKYLYIESKEEIPLKCKRADDQERFPSLKIQGGQWIMVHQRGNYIFEVFQEVTYPLPWGRNSYLTRQMTATTNIDVWVQQGQQNF